MSTIKISDETFEENVINNGKPIIVDFWAEWCGPCRSLAPILDEVSTEVTEGAKILKCNVDENGELAQQYGIRGIPTMIFFKDGEAAKTLVGVQTKEEIKKQFDELS